MERRSASGRRPVNVESLLITTPSVFVVEGKWRVESPESNLEEFLQKNLVKVEMNPSILEQLKKVSGLVFNTIHK